MVHFRAYPMIVALGPNFMILALWVGRLGKTYDHIEGDSLFQIASH